MKVTFRRQPSTWDPRVLGCQLDTELLPPDEAAQLQSLVEESGVLRAHSQLTRRPGPQVYEITVETDEGAHQISFDDMTMPEEVTPLVEYLQEHSGPLPLR